MINRTISWCATTCSELNLRDSSRVLYSSFFTRRFYTLKSPDDFVFF
jgi:hypothetical protein